MYINKFIDILDKASNSPSPLFAENINKFKISITQAIHFDFGEYPVGKSTNIFYSVPIIKMPYSLCTFSMTVEGKQRILIILNDNQEEDHIIFTVITLNCKKQLSIVPSMFRIKRGGTDIEVKDLNYFEDLPLSKKELENIQEDMANEDNIDAYCNMLRYANMILSCKNISTVDSRPQIKINKKRVKRGKLPLFTYKTLVFNQKRAKCGYNNAEQIDSNRVHLCRGHFKTFTDESPLLGQHTGTYWWQPQARGSKEKGMVRKDYKFKPSFK